MKLIIRIFNFAIVALSLAASVLLFAMPSFSFNSNITLDVVKISKIVPETIYTKDVDIAYLLGTDEIHVGIKFKMYADGIAKSMGGNRDVINNSFVGSSVDDVVTTLHEPVDLITDFTIRSILKSTVKAEMTKQVDLVAQKLGSGSTGADILDELQINDEYFTNFSSSFYDAANKDDATIDSITDVLYQQIDLAVAKAEDAKDVINSGFTPEKKTEIKDNLVKILTDLKLVESSGKLVKISHISYFYLSTYLHNFLKDKVSDPASLEKRADEDNAQYSDRMVREFVFTQAPSQFYQGVGTVCVFLFIGLFVFAGLWLLLLGLTIYRTFFCKKPWPKFGIWFWIVGSFQLVLGLGLTIGGKYWLPRSNVNFGALPLKSAILAPRTYALTSSILFLIALAMGVALFVLKIVFGKKVTSESEEGK